MYSLLLYWSKKMQSAQSTHILTIKFNPASKQFCKVLNAGEKLAGLRLQTVFIPYTTCGTGRLFKQMQWQPTADQWSYPIDPHYFLRAHMRLEFRKSSQCGFISKHVVSMTVGKHIPARPTKTLSCASSFMLWYVI